MKKSRLESWVKHAVRRWRQLYQSLQTIEGDSGTPSTKIFQPTKPQTRSPEVAEPEETPSPNRLQVAKKSPAQKPNLVKKAPKPKSSSSSPEKNTGRFRVKVKTIE